MYIRNIDYGVEENELRNLFLPFGKVKSVRLIRDEVSGLGKGFGFVEMEEASDALNAMSHRDGSDFRNRSISVSRAFGKESL